LLGKSGQRKRGNSRHRDHEAHSTFLRKAAMKLLAK
jgi:hypothetical protein